MYRLQGPPNLDRVLAEKAGLLSLGDQWLMVSIEHLLQVQDQLHLTLGETSLWAFYKGVNRVVE